VISEGLEGKRIAVTGATGFLGTAILERLLRCAPGCQVVPIVRPTRRSSAAERVTREILRNDCFDTLRTELGAGFDPEMEHRVTTIAGDVTTDGLGLDEEARHILASCDVVIHSAATVSFDAPLDSAVEVNLLGPLRVARAVLASRQTSTSDRPPSFIAVSTAYVAGARRGEAPEALAGDILLAPGAGCAWQDEVAAARRARQDVDAASRTPEKLSSFARAARRGLGAAGAPLLAERTERLRSDWVRERMVEMGRIRAQTLGWPDAYAYTKALGERALASADLPLPTTIVRPSIIESAMREPHPGWIRGFRMAEPVIVSYARGLLKEFPGVPEGIIDVIPVDLVVAAITAIAATTANLPEDATSPGSPRKPAVFHVASGARNPLRYGNLVDLVQGWFTEHPLYDAHGQPIVVPQWSFPGRGRVQRQLQRTKTILGHAERALGALPLRSRSAEWSAALSSRRDQVERALGYVQLYGAYTETDAIFRIDNLLSLAKSLPPEDRDSFEIDPAVIDWRSYVRDVHLPSVVEHARVRTTPGRRVPEQRSVRMRKAVLEPDRQLAVFDLEHTLIASNVVDSYAWLASRHLSARQRILFVADLLRKAPGLLALDRRDRGDFLRTFYQRYEGAPVDRLSDDAWELFHQQLLARSFPGAIARVRRHRALGHRTILITGALDIVVEPFRPLFDEIVCARLAREDGAFTGRMDELPPIGEARALVLDEYARAEGLDLAESVAYADSASDLQNCWK